MHFNSINKELFGILIDFLVSLSSPRPKSRWIFLSHLVSFPAKSNDPILMNVNQNTKQPTKSLWFNLIYLGPDQDIQ